MYQESAMLCATPSLSGSSGFLVGGQRVAGSSIQGSAQNRANLYAKRFRVTSIGSTEHWDRIGQFFAAFASGQTTASVALKRLVGHGPKNRFYRATRELGRVFKTEFILDYLSQPALRTRIRRGLLKGEQLHALARCVHYGRLGRLDQRDFERQTGAARPLPRFASSSPGSGSGSPGKRQERRNHAEQDEESPGRSNARVESRSHSGGAPGRENDTCRKSEAHTGRGYADNSRTLRTSQFTSNSVYWPPRRGTRSKDCCRKP